MTSASDMPPLTSAITVSTPDGAAAFGAAGLAVDGAGFAVDGAGFAPGDWAASPTAQSQREERSRGATFS